MKNLIFNLTNRPLDFNQLDELSPDNTILERKVYGNILTDMLNIFDEEHYIHSGCSPKDIAHDIASTVDRIITRYTLKSQHPIGLKKILLGCGIPQVLISDLELEFRSRGYIVIYSIYSRGKTMVNKRDTMVQYTTYQHQQWIEK